MSDTSSNEPKIVDPVDQLPHIGKLVPMSLQHVLVMYAGAVTVPLIVGRAANLSPEQLAFLVSADLFACGLVTLVQTIGFFGIGVRLPIMMGVTFVSVSPMLAFVGAGVAAGQPPEVLLTTIYGAVIIAGLFGLLISPFVGRVARFFPPIVTGTVILVIGLSLMRIAINWSAGGVPSSPSYGAPEHLLLAFATLIAILVIMKFCTGLVRSGAVLLGIIGGTLVALGLGQTSLSAVSDAPWFALVKPFQFGPPRFDLALSVSMVLVMLVVMVESFGMFLAAGEIVGRPTSEKDVVRGLRADSVGSLIGGVFNTFPYTSYAQNIGLLSITGVKSRFVCATGGLILLGFGLCPKLAALAAAVPLHVLGGAGIVMFGMIAATGVKMLASVELTQQRQLTIAVSVAIGMIPILSEKFFHSLPASMAPLMHSGIVLAAVCAVALNSLFSIGEKSPKSEP